MKTVIIDKKTLKTIREVAEELNLRYNDMLWLEGNLYEVTSRAVDLDENAIRIQVRWIGNETEKFSFVKYVIGRLRS